MSNSKFLKCKNLHQHNKNYYKTLWCMSMCVCTFILMSRPCFSSSFLMSWAPSRAAFSTKCFHSIGWKTWGSWGTYRPIFTCEKQAMKSNASLLIQILFSYLHTTCPPSSSPLCHPFLPSSGCAGISCRSSRIQPPILPVCGGSVVCPSGPGGGSYPVIRSGRCSRHPAQHGGSSGLKTGS